MNGSEIVTQPAPIEEDDVKKIIVGEEDKDDPEEETIRDFPKPVETPVEKMKDAL